MASTVLVTGCAGFIGSKVSEFLLAEDRDVVGADNLNDAYDVRLKNWRLEQLEGRPGFEFHRLDICDRTALSDLFHSLFAICHSPAGEDQIDQTDETDEIDAKDVIRGLCGWMSKSKISKPSLIRIRRDSKGPEDGTEVRGSGFKVRRAGKADWTYLLLWPKVGTERSPAAPTRTCDREVEP